MSEQPYPSTFWREGTVSRDLATARALRAAAVAACVAAVVLAVAHEWLAFGLVLWLVPSLLLVAGLAHRAHNRRKGGGDA